MTKSACIRPEFSGESARPARNLRSAGTRHLIPASSLPTLPSLRPAALIKGGEKGVGEESRGRKDRRYFFSYIYMISLLNFRPYYCPSTPGTIGTEAGPQRQLLAKLTICPGTEGDASQPFPSLCRSPLGFDLHLFDPSAVDQVPDDVVPFAGADAADLAQKLSPSDLAGFLDKVSDHVELGLVLGTGHETGNALHHDPR